MTYDELLALLKHYAEAAGLRMDRNCWFILSDVVKLHKPTGSPLTCLHCDSLSNKSAYSIDYPCPTIQAIEAELNA